MDTINNYSMHKKIHTELDVDIPDRYKKYMLHVALEQADMAKDWKTFRILYKISPIFLKNHLKMTSFFEYNYTKLPMDKQNELFKE
jgi:hypothetical protein